MTKLALLAVAAAAALVSGASAQTLTKTDYQTCDTAFLTQLLSVLQDSNSALSTCLSAATAPFLAAASLPANTSTAVVLSAFFAPDTASNTANLFITNLQQTAKLNAAWWGVFTGIVNTTACTSASSTSTPNLAASGGPCADSAYQAVWNAPAGQSVTYGQVLSDFYVNGLPQLLSYVALAPLLTYVPPCLPTNCQAPLVTLCQNPASGANSTSTTIKLFSNLFTSIQSFESSANSTLSAALGASLAAGSKGAIPTHVNKAFDCTSFGGWGTSLNATYGGSKSSDATSSARVGVLAAAVAVMAAAIAA